TQAPLLRLTCLRLGEADFRLICTSHHALLDSHSHLLVLQELFAFYEALRQGQELDLEPPRPYRNYIDWRAQQDWSPAEPFWRQLLQGFHAPTPLLSVAPAPGSAAEARHGHGARTLRLSARLTAALHALAQ